MEQGYYSVIATPREALYEAACSMDNQDVPLEDWPMRLIAALTRAGFAVVPAELPHDVLGRAAIAGVAETGNPKHAWEFLIDACAAADAEIARLREALIEVAATLSWQAFGDCRAFDQFGKSGPVLPSHAAESLAKDVLKGAAE